MNSFGRLFRINIFGESHGKAVGVTIDGCPAGISIAPDDFLHDLTRRKSGAKGTTPRIEADLPQLLSGVFNGKTTGTPLTIIFENTNIKPGDYENLLAQPRPGHADFVALNKFGGFGDSSGGGHFSGRLTLAIGAVGVLAKKIIHPISISAKLLKVGGKEDIQKTIEEAMTENDSVGGLIECIATHLPVGLGEPFFDSVESLISHIVFAIPAIKGIEFGSGFAAAEIRGSENNDAIISADGKTSTNHAGGINGGTTNGNDLVFRVAVKPTSSIGKSQMTYNLASNSVEELKVAGRHDACIALRVPPVIEAATAIVLADLMLLEQRVKRVVEK